MKTTDQVVKKTLLLEQDLKKYAYSLTVNQDDADDLLQDTYLKVMQYSTYFKEETNLKAWVYTIMKNTFINNYRKKQRSKVVFDQSEDLYYLNNSVSDAADAADAKYYASEINKMILRKNEEQRKPFEMYLDGYKYHEIADEMNISIGTVKSRIFFTRKKLMEDLKDYVATSYA